MWYAYNIFFTQGNGEARVANTTKEEEKAETENKVTYETENTNRVTYETENRITYNVVLVTSEVAPYSKTGGLGDVCGSLPIALAARGHRVMVVSPRYQRGTSDDSRYCSAFDLQRRIQFYCFGGFQEVAFFHEYRDGVDWVRTLNWLVFYMIIISAW